MLKLYLDIDGVLLTAKNPRPADYAAEFIEFVTANFDCYWLTTHCLGDAKPALDYLSEYFDEATMERLRTIKPTRWDTLKTDAIDFDSEFVWIDDYAMLAEKETLKKHNASDALILTDLDGRSNLRNIIYKLQERLSMHDMILNDNCNRVLRACEYIGVNIDDFNLVYNMFLRDVSCRSIHGINHIYRTMTSCAMLGELLRKPRAGLLAFCGAYIHDLARTNEGIDPEHGQRAADMFFHRFDSLWNKYGLTDRERTFVMEAVAQHSTCEWMQPSDEGYDVMAILKDADALDRCRLGDGGLNPALLRLPKSRLLIETAKFHFVSTEYNGKPVSFRKFIRFYRSELK